MWEAERFFLMDMTTGYDFDACAECGECLAACPYINLGGSGARREIRRLRQGRYSRVLERCAGCATCDAACPRGCRPYALIRQRWGERYGSKGIPEKARYLMPTEFPNFRSAVGFTREEKKILKRISGPPRGGVALYTGCNTLVFPGLLESKIFDGAEPFGSFEYCCGEMYYRMGMMDAARRTAERLADVFDSLRIEKMVFICAACMNLVSNVYPKEFGIELDFEKQFIADWLLEKIGSGKLDLKERGKRTLTVQDSCHSKMMGEWMHRGPRLLLGMTGAEIIEREHTKDESLCCGIAAGCAGYRAAGIAAVALKALEESRLTGADATATYCNGCQLTLSMARQFYPLAPPVVPMIQVVQQAVGERPDTGLPARRAAGIMRLIAINAAL